MSESTSAEDLERLRSCVRKLLDLDEGSAAWQEVEEMNVSEMADFLEEQDDLYEEFINSVIFRKVVAERELSVLYEQLYLILKGATAAALVFDAAMSPAQNVTKAFFADIQRAILKADQAGKELRAGLCLEEPCQPNDQQ